MKPSHLAVALAAGLFVQTLAGAPIPEIKIEKSLLNRLTTSEDAVASFFVVFEGRANLKPAYYIRGKAERGGYVVGALKATADRSQAGVRGYLRGLNIDFTPFWVENKIYIPQGSYDLARTLALRPEVIAVIPEQTHALPPTQPAETSSAINAAEWGIAKIRANQVWSELNVKGTGIVVANNDTGVQYNHPAVVRQYRGNLGASFDHQGNWKDPAVVCATLGVPCDNNGHGTHTMGTMVGETADLANQIGVAPAAKWIACKGCETTSCSDFSLISCAQWYLDPMGDGDTSLQPDIVNNSWGGGGGDAWYQTYVDSWRASGIFPAFSIGNSGSACGSAGSPGDYPASFASGATDSNDNIASFSSRGPSQFGGGIKPDVSAPGVSVRSSVPTNNYAAYGGTSMASPHTAGTVALVWSAAPSYRGNIAGTMSLLQSTATPRTISTQSCGGVPGTIVPNNTYGYGRIDAYAAVQAALGSTPNQPPTVTITSPSAGSQPCGVALTFSATASDPEDGSLTLISWIDNGSAMNGGSPATTFSKTYFCTELGNHNIVASVKDSGNLTDTDTITINVYDPAVPAAPTSLKASASRGGGVTLSFTDNATNESGFRVERRSKGTVAWTTNQTLAQKVGTGKVTASDNPGPGTWEYRVIALNGTKESAPSNISSVRVR